MNMNPVFQLACEIAFGVLSIATLLAWILAKRSPQNETLKKVLTIIYSWWIILGVFLASLAVGKFGLALLFYLLSLFTAKEYLALSSLQKIRRPLFFVFTACTTLQYIALVSQNVALYFASVALLAAFIAPALIIANAAIENLGIVFAATTGMLLATHWLSYVPALPILLPSFGYTAEAALLSVVLLVMLVECNDVFQFLCGKMFGRRKVVPLISPNKTGAGFVGGLILTTLLSATMSHAWLHLPLVQGAVLGIVVAVAGVLGDLFFSAVKRHLKVKDFSSAIPGHGGVLDRLDSLIIAAPFYFHALLLLK